MTHTRKQAFQGYTTCHSEVGGAYISENAVVENGLKTKRWKTFSSVEF